MSADVLTPEQWMKRNGGKTESMAPSADGTSKSETSMNAQAGDESNKPLRIIDPRELFGLPVPEREWIVDQWLPTGHVTLNYADGALGKTLVAQQLMTSCATGKPWLGLAVTRCRSLALFCEDDEAEIHRRQDRINDALGIRFDGLEDMGWICAVGKDNALVRFDRDGRPVLTERYDEIRRFALAFGARLLVIDTAADTFGGNENDRAQVRSFLGFVLNGLARDIRGAVLLNAHPSRSGMASSGDMDGGSTAWSNTARSRWALVRPKGEDDEEVDPDLRILSRKKANYASRDAEIKLRWHQGAFVPLNRPASTLGGISDTIECENAFLELLARCDALNMPLSTAKNAGNWAPRVFSKRPDGGGFSAKQFDQAMSALFTAKRITLVSYGRPGNDRRRIGRVEDAGEASAEDAAA